MSEEKPNCYECQYRGNIPGDAHSMCHHPEVKQDGNMFTALIGMMSGDNLGASKKLNIKAQAHGVRSGWFMWPANFDPVWLISCNGFKQREKK